MRTSVSSLEPTEKPDIVTHACSPSAGGQREKYLDHAGQPASPNQQAQVLVQDPVSGSKTDSSKEHRQHCFLVSHSTCGYPPPTHTHICSHSDTQHCPLASTQMCTQMQVYIHILAYIYSHIQKPQFQITIIFRAYINTEKHFRINA